MKRGREKGRTDAKQEGGRSGGRTAAPGCRPVSTLKEGADP